MRARHVITAVAIVFVGGFAFLTFAALIDQGVTLGTVLSIGVLVLIAVGILGALASHDPDD